MTIFDLFFIGVIIGSLPFKFFQMATGLVLLFGVHILHDQLLKFYIRKSARSVVVYKYRFGNLPGKLLNELMLTAIDHEDFVRGYMGYLRVRSRREINLLRFIEILSVFCMIMISWIDPFWWVVSMVIAVSMGMWARIKIYIIKNPIITCYHAAKTFCQATSEEKIEDPLVIRAGCGTQAAILGGALLIVFVFASMVSEAILSGYLAMAISIVAGLMCGKLFGGIRMSGEINHFDQYLGDALRFMQTALGNLHEVDRDGSPSSRPM
jgi:hypothetical protein